MFRPTRETVRTPRPNKEEVKKLYKAYGGNPNDGEMTRIMRIIDDVYDKLFPEGEEV